MREEKLEKIKELELLIKTNERNIFELEKSRNFQSVYEGFFSSLLSDKLIIKSDRDGRVIQFKMNRNDGKKYEGVFNIYFPWSLADEIEVDYTGIELNYYTTNSNCDFQFARLIMLGKVAEFISNRDVRKQLWILYNETKNLFTEERNEMYKIKWDAEKKIQILNQEVKDIDKQIKLDNLSSSGVSYLQGKWIDVKHGVTLRNIVFIQLLNYTTSSKKTATFKFKDGSGNEMVYDRVKVPNIISQI